MMNIRILCTWVTKRIAFGLQKEYPLSSLSLVYKSFFPYDKALNAGQLKF